jgi:protein SCO1/2
VGQSSLFRPYAFRGHELNPVKAAPDFVLLDQNGNRFSLSSLKGRTVMMFFGYTYCPDACPTTLTKFRQIKEQMGDKAQQVAFVFVTVDPERDTPDRLKEYLRNVDPSFIGLTGDRDTLEKVWKDYGVYAEKEPAPTGSTAGYYMAHSSFTYLIDRQGNLRLIFPFETTAQDMASDLLAVLRQ